MLKKSFYILLVLISIKAVAQRTNSSPYSFFGIGQQYNSQTVEQASMGGIGIAYTNAYHLNSLNPASNANLRFTTYTIGMNINDLTIKDASGSQKSTSTGLSYVHIGFPIGEKAAVTFGLQPNSAVGYSLIHLDDTKDPREVTRFYGNGGTSKLFGTFGIKVFENFTLGLEAEYVFGKVENSVLNEREGIHLATKNNEIVTIRGTGIKLGAQYKKDLSKNLTMNFGAVVKFENKLKTEGTAYLYTLSVEDSSLEIPRDTLSQAVINGNLRNPIRTSLGVGVGKTEAWYVGVEYEFQAALGNQDSFLSASHAYGNSNKVALGGFYLPKANSISSYFERITYRAGIRFEKTGLLVANTTLASDFTEINDFGISFGLGLPLRQLSNLNIGLEYGKKGTLSNNLIEENYFNVKLSLSLNAIGNFAWFQKRTID